MMFVKRRKLSNFNNNNVDLENKNYPFNHNVLTKFCLQHKLGCEGNSPEVNQDNYHRSRQDPVSFPQLQDVK